MASNNASFLNEYKCFSIYHRVEKDNLQSNIANQNKRRTEEEEKRKIFNENNSIKNTNGITFLYFWCSNFKFINFIQIAF